MGRMVRSVDIPGKDKHLRFGKLSEEIQKAIIEFPGVKAVVLHVRGKSGEHPHWHVWYESPKEITNQTVRDRMKKVEVLSHFGGQNDWSFRNHDNWTQWAQYVTKNGSHQVIVDYTRDDVQLSVVSEENKKLIIAINVDSDLKTPLALNAPVKRASETMRAKFCRYLANEIGWLKNETIAPDNYDLKIKELVDLMTDFWENAFTTPQGAVCIEHAKYVFANDDVRAIIRKSNQVAIIKCLR